jgi:hypothetical protein
MKDGNKGSSSKRSLFLLPCTVYLGINPSAHLSDVIARMLLALWHEWKLGG